MYNIVQLEGNITKEPEMKKMNNKDFAQFDIAVYKGQNSSFFVRVKAWEKSALYASDLIKGDRVIVFGKLDVETWDGNDGKKNSKTVVICNAMRKISKKVNNVHDANFGMDEEAF